MVTVKPCADGIRIILEREFKREAETTLELIKEGDHVPLYVGNIILGEVLVGEKVHYHTSNQHEFTLFVFHESTVNCLEQFGLGHRSTLSLQLVEGKVRFLITDKKNYSPSEFELDPKPMRFYNTYAMAQGWDHKLSLYRIVDNIDNVFVFDDSGEHKLALQLKDEEDLTVLKHTPFGWLYDADMGTNIETMSGLQLMDAETAFKHVVTFTSYSQFNP